MSDDRISRYLSDRAAEIELRPASVEAVVGRATRRRRTRRGAVAAATALIVGAAAVVVAQRGEPAGELATNTASVTESPFDWAVADVSTGVSSFRSPTAITDDGAVYTLSTAPGPSEDDLRAEPKTLYRSLDGAEWAPVELPGDFWASSLAGAGDQLYAVGTSPAGGGVTYRIATSGDGGATWSMAEVPSELADVQAQYPGEVRTAPPSVAVRDGAVVISTSVYGSLDVAARVPGGLPDTAFWQATDDGVVVSTADAECVPPATVPAGDGADAAGEAAEDEATWSDVATWSDEAIESWITSCGDLDPEAGQSYTWAQLGVDDELRDLVLDGRSTVLVAHDGGEFSPVDAGTGNASAGQVVATDEGFTLFLTRSSSTGGAATAPVTEVLRSGDGLSWEPAGELPGYLTNTGSIGGRAAAALFDVGGGTLLQLAQADGSWLPVDPRDALESPRGTVERVAFGPLGWAAVVWPEPPDDGADASVVRPAVVHSVDGTSMSVVPLDDLVPSDQVGQVDPSVTADAVVVRMTAPGDGDPATPSPQQVVVGTPGG